MNENVLIPINRGKMSNLRCVQEANNILPNGGTLHGLYVDSDNKISDVEEDVIEHTEDMLDSSNHNYVMRRVEGSIVDEIIRYDREMPIDTIVMYTYNKSGIQSLIGGSVTESVIDKTDTPVLVLSENIED